MSMSAELGLTAVMRTHNAQTLQAATSVNVTLDSLETGSHAEHKSKAKSH